MDLEIFNKLIDNIKDNEKIQNFIEDLEKNLKYKTNNLFVDKENLTTEYRDKIKIEEREILENYAKETQEFGEMYKVYNKIGGEYLLTNCSEGRSHEIIKLNKNEFLEDIKINSILRKKENQYILDINSTEIVNKKINNEINKLLQEQEIKMNSNRKEGHIYEFVEKTEKSISLIDNSLNNAMSFEEFIFDKDIFKNAKEGDLFQYKNGKYEKI